MSEAYGVLEAPRASSVKIWTEASWEPLPIEYCTRKTVALVFRYECLKTVQVAPSLLGNGIPDLDWGV
jgi:hypothetical protein